MSNEEKIIERKIPILRLRPTVPTELICPRQQVKQPDGPWIAHPYLIDEETSAYRKKKIHAPDITMKEYRDLWKEDNVLAVEKLKGTNIEDFNIVSILELLPSIHMQKILGRTDHEIASRIERHYVGAHQYRSPFHVCFDSHCGLTFISCNIGIWIPDTSRLPSSSIVSAPIGGRTLEVSTIAITSLLDGSQPITAYGYRR
jgi:hypothetical protein